MQAVYVSNFDQSTVLIKNLVCKAEYKLETFLNLISDTGRKKTFKLIKQNAIIYAPFVSGTAGERGRFEIGTK